MAESAARMHDEMTLYSELPTGSRMLLGHAEPAVLPVYQPMRVHGGGGGGRGGGGSGGGGGLGGGGGGGTHSTTPGALML